MLATLLLQPQHCTEEWESLFSINHYLTEPTQAIRREPSLAVRAQDCKQLREPPRSSTRRPLSVVLWALFAARLQNTAPSLFVDEPASAALWLLRLLAEMRDSVAQRNI